MEGIKNSRRMERGCYYSYTQKEDNQGCNNYRGISFLNNVLPTKYTKPTRLENVWNKRFVIVTLYLRSYIVNVTYNKSKMKTVAKHTLRQNLYLWKD